MTKYDESYLDDYEYDKSVVFCRTNWKYVLKSYFVVIMPKYAFLKYAKYA